MSDNTFYNTAIVFSDIHFHFPRPRIDNLLTQAVNYPLVTVTAGAGYGKTKAALAFLNHRGIRFSWLQLREFVLYNRRSRRLS